MNNCDVVGSVDFGKGNVEVRCTENGPHATHKCIVILKPPELDLEHRNVFDQKE